MSATSTIHAKTPPPPATMFPPLDDDNSDIPQSVPLSMIVPSKTNPGRTYDQERDAETMESIRIHKVLQSIVLRAPGVKDCSFNVPGKLEIVAGERRYHCSIVAGKTHIPATIRRLSDAEALEIQYLENEDRKDLHPMAKAAALRRVWDAYKAEGKDAKECMERVIERTGRKPRTVWNQLSLGNFIERGQALLSAEKISISHAYEIARRARAEQNMLINWYEEEIEYGDRVSVRDLKDYIRHNCDHFIDSAPFVKTDAQLVHEAGACTACMKNTAVNPNIADDDGDGKKQKVKAICTDGQCWDAKVKANLVQIQVQTKKEHGDSNVLRLSTLHNPPKGCKSVNEWKEVKEGSCKHAFVGVVEDGGDIGKKLFACAFPNLCKTHWKTREDNDVERRVVSRPRSDSEKKAMLAKQRNKKADQAYRAAAAPALRKAVTDLKTEDLRDVALQMVHMTDRRHRNPIFAAMGWKTGNSLYGAPIPVKNIEALKHPDLCAFLALMTVASKVLPGLEEYWPATQVPLAPFAKRHKVDLVKIEAAATRPLRERWKEIDARKKGKSGAAQTSAVKRAKSAAA